MNKVLIFFHTLNGGGVERMMCRMAGALQARGFPVEIVVFDKSGNMAGEVPAGVTITEIVGRSITRTTLKFAKYLKTSRPGIIISATHIPNFIAYWGNRISGVNAAVIMSQRGMGGEPYEAPATLKAHFFRPAIRYAYRGADAIIAVSKAIAANLNEIDGLDPRKIRQIYNPVIDRGAVEKLASAPIIGDCSWLNDGDVNVVLGLGRLSWEKGFDSLIRSFALLDESLNARLLIVGDGPERARLEDLVQKLNLEQKAYFAGFQSNTFAYMSRADVFVLSSLEEGFGNVIPEALACGTPVVSTNCPGGPAEILDYGRYGILTQVGDDREMADAIATTLRNPPDRDMLVARGMQFSVEKSVDQYVDLIREFGRAS